MTNPTESYSQPPIWEQAPLPPPTPPPVPNPRFDGGDGGGKKPSWFRWLGFLIGAAAATALVAVGVVVLVNLGGDDKPAPKATAQPAATASPTPTTGPTAFLADVAKVGFGDKDTSDPTFLKIGNLTCEGFNDGVSYGDVVSAYTDADAKPTLAQAEAVVRSAVRNLCPEYKEMLP